MQLCLLTSISWKDISLHWVSTKTLKCVGMYICHWHFVIFWKEITKSPFSVKQTQDQNKEMNGSCFFLVSLTFFNSISVKKGRNKHHSCEVPVLYIYHMSETANFLTYQMSVVKPWCCKCEFTVVYRSVTLTTLSWRAVWERTLFPKWWSTCILLLTDNM